jgi:hypothetical protein
VALPLGVALNNELPFTKLLALKEATIGQSQLGHRSSYTVTLCWPISSCTELFSKIGYRCCHSCPFPMSELYRALHNHHEHFLASPTAVPLPHIPPRFGAVGEETISEIVEF